MLNVASTKVDNRIKFKGRKYFLSKVVNGILGKLISIPSFYSTEVLGNSCAIFVRIWSTVIITIKAAIYKTRNQAIQSNYLVS